MKIYLHVHTYIVEYLFPLCWLSIFFYVTKKIFHLKFVQKNNQVDEEEEEKTDCGTLKCICYQQHFIT